MQLGKVERISTKLSIMNYIGNFFDNLHLITPQIHAVISAASSVKSSKKLRAVLEIILAFGNYLNSSKRGPAYGFKLQSLDTLLDTKSTDKRMCLLHYIVATIRLKFPELINFESEMMYIDKAATGNGFFFFFFLYLIYSQIMHKCSKIEYFDVQILFNFNDSIFTAQLIFEVLIL